MTTLPLIMTVLIVVVMIAGISWSRKRRPRDDD
jgi:hypothetical protein